MTQEKQQYEIIDEKDDNKGGRKYSQKPQEMILMEKKIKERNMNRYFQKIRKEKMYSEFSNQFTLKTPQYNLEFRKTLNGMYNQHDMESANFILNTQTFNTQRTNGPIDTSMIEPEQTGRQSEILNESQFNKIREIQGILKASNNFFSTSQEGALGSSFQKPFNQDVSNSYQFEIENQPVNPIAGRQMSQISQSLNKNPREISQNDTFYQSYSEKQKNQINFAESQFVKVQDYINREKDQQPYISNFVTKRRNLIHYMSVDPQPDSPKLQFQQRQSILSIENCDSSTSNIMNLTGTYENSTNPLQSSKANLNLSLPLQQSFLQSTNNSPLAQPKFGNLKDMSVTQTYNRNLNQIMNQVQINTSRDVFTIPQLELQKDQSNFDISTSRNQFQMTQNINRSPSKTNSPKGMMDSDFQTNLDSKLASARKSVGSPPRKEDFQRLNPEDPRLQMHFRQLYPKNIKGSTHRNIRISRENIKDFMSKRYGPQLSEKFIIFLDIVMKLDFQSFIMVMDVLLNITRKEQILFCFLMFDSFDDGYIDNSDLFFLFKSSRFNKMIEMDILEIIEFCQTQLNQLKNLDTEENFIESLMVKRNNVILTQYRVMVQRGKQLTIPTDLKKDTLYHLSFNVIQHSSNSRLTMQQIQENKRKVAEKEQQKPKITEYISETKFCLNFDHFTLIFQNKVPYIYYDIVRYICLFQYDNMKYVKTDEFIFEASEQNKTISEIDQMLDTLAEKQRWDEMIRRALAEKKDLSKELEQYRNEVQKMRDFLNLKEDQEQSNDKGSPIQQQQDQGQITSKILNQTQNSSNNKQIDIFQMKENNLQSQF